MMFVLFLAGFVALIIYLASIMPSDVGCTQKHNGMDFKNATITQPPGEADTLSCFYDDNTTVTKQYDALSTNGLYWRRMDPDRIFAMARLKHLLAPMPASAVPHQVTRQMTTDDY